MFSTPNIVFVFADQWRAPDCGYAGNPDVHTPNIDRLAGESVNVVNAVAGCPVCSPYRASLLTGQYPLTHGVYENDVRLDPDAVSERRQGWEYWKALNCTHRYHHSLYYTDDDPEPRVWDDYDAFAQTRDAQRYIRENAGKTPFALMLSWGPPHAPYETAPEAYRQMYQPDRIRLRDNVPESSADRAREMFAGYYAHITALDDCMGWLMETLDACGITDNTLLVFTSDHGDMLGSHGAWKKQQPWEESINVPFLLRYPALLGRESRQTRAVLDAPDIMPTLFSMCGVPVPGTVEGEDMSPYIRGEQSGQDTDAVLLLPVPFGQWTRKDGGREYRGLRTPRYTYVRDLDGPWLLFDNREDPYQLHNLCDVPEYAEIQQHLEERLQIRLRQTGDSFEHAGVYVQRVQQWGYEVDENGTTTFTM